MQAVPRSRPCGRTSGKPSADRLRALPPGKVNDAGAKYGREFREIRKNRVIVRGIPGEHKKHVVKEQETGMQAGQETGIRAVQKFREKAEVLQNTRIAKGIYDLRLKTKQIAAAAKPGQFVSVYSNDHSRLLPRPISICGADPESGELRLVFRVAGRGTEEFSRLSAGDRVDLTGPLGNGFPESVLKGQAGKTVFLIGGGIGIPPMVQLARTLAAGDDEKGAPRLISVLGFRDELFLVDDLKAYSEVVIATEDGSCGTKGNVLDAIRGRNLKADVICACGPTPMLRALRAYAQETGTECWLSLEEKMACGIGACLSCVCKSTDIDEHSRVRNKRVCTEGPVFNSIDIEL